MILNQLIIDRSIHEFVDLIIDKVICDEMKVDIYRVEILIVLCIGQTAYCRS